MMRKFTLTVLILLSVHTYANSNTVNDYRELTTVCDTNVNMDKLINVLIHVESKGNANAISKNGTCVGALQIKKLLLMTVIYTSKNKNINTRIGSMKKSQLKCLKSFKQSIKISKDTEVIVIWNI